VARFVLHGPGVVGARAARQLLSVGPVDSLSVVGGTPSRAEAVVAALGGPARLAAWDEALAEGPDTVVLAGGPGHARLAAAALDAGAHVVSVADGEEEVAALLELDAHASRLGRTVVAGAGFSPGMSCVIAAHGAAQLDAVDEIRVASAGTAGPACARQHHRSLSSAGLEWGASGWVRRRAGSGRELCWFPDPVGPRDCYRGALAEPLLLQRAFPAAARISARRAASRRDRLTARLPMLRPPHREGLVGALRVEVIGRSGSAVDSRVLGAIDRPSIATGAVAALAAHWAAAGRLAGPGAGGLAELVAEPVPFLRDLSERGVRAAVFTGAGQVGGRVGAGG